jgi:hypothetical protein
VPPELIVIAPPTVHCPVDTLQLALAVAEYFTLQPPIGNIAKVKVSELTVLIRRVRSIGFLAFLGIL